MANGLLFLDQFQEILALSLCCLVIVYSAPTPEDEAPHPYSFAFEEKDVNFTIARKEEMDATGVVTGSYSYIDKDGLFRTVNYVADDDGFRATIDSNEPGLVSSAPAGATYSVQ